jgi:hypothetical protein
MRLKVIHLYVPAVISYIFALLSAFSREPIGAVIFSSLYLVLLASTKWVGET